MRSGQNGTSLGKFVDILTGGHAETSTCLHGALKMKNVSDFEAKKRLLRLLKGSPGLTIKASLKDNLTSPRLPLSAQAGNWVQRLVSHIHWQSKNVGLRMRARTMPKNGAANE